MGYYDRKPTVNLDGTTSFQNEDDSKNEAEVAQFLEEKWGCSLHRFARMFEIDFYAVRDGHQRAIIEVKCRDIPSTAHKTVWLNVRKWYALLSIGEAMRVPAYYVVKWNDGAIRYLPLNEIDPYNVSFGGCAYNVKSNNDREFVINIPVLDMRPLAHAKTAQPAEAPTS